MWRAASELRRTAGTRQYAGELFDRAGSRTRVDRGAADDGHVRADRRDAGDDEGGRGVYAAGCAATGGATAQVNGIGASAVSADRDDRDGSAVSEWIGEVSVRG